MNQTDQTRPCVLRRWAQMKREQRRANLREAKKKHVLVGVVSQLRFSPAVVQVKRAMERGVLGKMACADLYMKYHRSQAYYDSAAWRGTWKMDGGGALMNQGIHGVDLLQYLAGPVDSIYAKAKTQVRKIARPLNF